MAAWDELYLAIKRGEIKRAGSCEICGTQQWNRRNADGKPVASIYGHHWRGYDYPLDVWWVCPGCNRWLGSRHDGSWTLEQAKREHAKRKRKRTR